MLRRIVPFHLGLAGQVAVRRADHQERRAAREELSAGLHAAVVARTAYGKHERAIENAALLIVLGAGGIGVRV